MKLKITISHTDTQHGKTKTHKADWTIEAPENGKKQRVVLHIDPYDLHTVTTQIEEVKDVETA